MTTSVAVVLAAGASRRLGRPKQLVEYGGEPLVRHAARIAIGSGCSRTVVIWGAVPLDHALEGLPVELIHNPQWQEGIASSIRTAAGLARGSRLLLTLVDQPLITSAHLRALVESNAPVAATGYAGTVGAPVAFDASIHPQLMALQGDQGARSIVASQAEHLLTVPFEAAAADVDSETDLDRLLQTRS